MNEDLQALIQEMLNSGMSQTQVDAFLLLVWNYISQGNVSDIDDQLANTNNSTYINAWSLFDEQIMTLDINILKWYVNPH
jgi:hypothetical protein